MTLKSTSIWPVIAIISMVAGCSGPVRSDSVAERSQSPAPTTENRELHSPVRSFDFANFTYPAAPIYGKGISDFTLKDGEYEGAGDFEPVYLSYLVYGDVTGDSQEEALVTLVLSIKGTAIPFINYIYAAVDGRPKLLWAFRNGDRADNGLRQIYGEDGQLVVERFSPIGKNGAFATQFTRVRYRWNGTRFHETGTAELLPNPTNNSSPVMQPYRASKTP